jgi:azurin
MEVIKMKNMKKYFSQLIFAAAISLSLFSCSSNQQTKEQSKEDTAASASSNLMNEGPAYDVNKIDPAAPVTEITLKTLGNSMSEMKYDQKEIHVKEGSTVKLKLINEAKDSSMQHNFVLIEPGTADKVATEGMKSGPDHNYIPGIKDVFAGTSLVGPGGRTEITFPAPPKGTYDFICTYPGHYKTMNGKFIVE